MENIPKCYKKTEIGVIPEDWGTEILSEVMSVSRGGSPRPIDTYITQSPSGVNWVKIGDVEKGAKYIYRTREKIKPEGKKYSREVQNGDFLLSNSMSFGRPYILKTSGCIHDGWLVLQNYKEYFDQEFLYYHLSSEMILDQYRKRASGSSVLNLNKELVSSINVAILSKEEQKLIASSLSDIDSLITSLEKLIEKKKMIRQGVMQKLLKPQKYWTKKRLGDVATLKARIGWQGLTTAEYLKTGNYYLVTGTEFENGYIDWNSCHYVEEVRYKQDPHIQLKENDVLVTKDGTIGKIALIDTLNKPATLNSGVFVIRPLNKSFHPKFFYYLLLSSIFTDFLNQLTAGSTINHLYQKDFVNFEFYAPKDLEIQKEISESLHSMDQELKLLEVKLSKLKQIKQGAMQQLLTGKIRLINK